MHGHTTTAYLIGPSNHILCPSIHHFLLAHVSSSTTLRTEVSHPSVISGLPECEPHTRYADSPANAMSILLPIYEADEHDSIGAISSVSTDGDSSRSPARRGNIHSRPESASTRYYTPEPWIEDRPGKRPQLPPVPVLSDDRDTLPSRAASPPQPASLKRYRVPRAGNDSPNAYAEPGFETNLADELTRRSNMPATAYPHTVTASDENAATANTLPSGHARVLSVRRVSWPLRASTPVWSEATSATAGVQEQEGQQEARHVHFAPPGQTNNMPTLGEEQDSPDTTQREQDWFQTLMRLASDGAGESTRSPRHPVAHSGGTNETPGDLLSGLDTQPESRRLQHTGSDTSLPRS